MAQMKPLPKLVLLAAVVAGVIYGGSKVAGYYGIGILKSVQVSKANLPDAKDAVVEHVDPLPFPSAKPTGCGDAIRYEKWAWNAGIGPNYSNGGIDTTVGSLQEKFGNCLHINRQDDTNQNKADLSACAKDLKTSTECSNGVHFVEIMMDGSGQFLAPLNAELRKICADCIAEQIGTTGYSRGEDGFWGPEAWKKNPKAALGDGLNAGVLGDGDWNSSMKWAGDNSLRNNPDIHTFDPTALNWVNADTYLDAAEKYINHYCEDRKVVTPDGKLTGQTVNVCVKGYVTWTPGDVNAATKKGGAVPIVTTREYRSQMPSAVIGIKKWNEAHRDKVKAMLAAFLVAGDQIKAYPKALELGGDISAKIYCGDPKQNCGEETHGAYWVKYYKGVTENDATGRPVKLGGSYADNMNDALALFGLDGKSNNNAKNTYTTFAKIVSEQYPKLFKDAPIPPFEQVTDTSYLLQARAMLDNAGSEADKPVYSADTQVNDIVSDKSVNIEFALGSDKLTQAGMAAVRDIKNQAALTGMTVLLYGHTDDSGPKDVNRRLSLARAKAVKQAIESIASADFPEDRFRVQGFGPDKPIASNATEEGRARNRRVEVILAQ